MNTERCNRMGALMMLWCYAAFLALLVMKVAGLDLPWIWVLSPLWGSAGLFTPLAYVSGISALRAARRESDEKDLNDIIDSVSFYRRRRRSRTARMLGDDWEEHA